MKNAIKQVLMQRQTVLGLLLMEENRQSVTKDSTGEADRLSQTLLLDQVVNLVDGESIA